MLISMDYDKAVRHTVPNWRKSSAYDSCPGAELTPDQILEADRLEYFLINQQQEDALEQSVILDDDSSSLAQDTVNATYNLYNRIVGDYDGSIEGGSQYIGVLNTRWTVIYQFNSIFYSILALQSLFLVFGIIIIPIRIITSFLHCFLTGFIHIAMIITTGALRYNSRGQSCALSHFKTSANTTFAEDGEFIERLFISQCVLFLTFCVSSCCAGTINTPTPERRDSDEPASSPTSNYL